jgi:polar amino acid transport system substrate-binding protein
MKRAILTCAVLSLLATGCAGTSDQVMKASLAALATQPPASQQAAQTPNVNCSDVRASLKPPATLPAPGHMPAGSFMAAIQKRGYLLAGVNQNYLLFGYLNPATGQIEGFEIDLLREIARAIFGNPNALEFKALNVPQRLPFVQQGLVDIVADAVTMTCPRRQQVDFSTVYYDAGQRLLVPVDSRVGSLAQLGHEPVCATVDSVPLMLLQAYPTRPTPVAAKQGTDCMVDLQEGTVAGISTDDSILLGFQAQDPNTKIVGPPLADAPYGMAISNKHPEFVRFVNGVLARLFADGTWQRIYAHWLAPHIGGKVASPPPLDFSQG